MSHIHVHHKFYNFKDLKVKEESKENNAVISQISTLHTSNRFNLLKEMSLLNNNISNIERNHSSINIPKIKKFSKFKINKNDKSTIRKNSTSKLLNILKNSEKSKNKSIKKESINEINKNLKIESEQKKLRYDNFGNIINKKNKKIVHIVFKDDITEKPIIEEIQIESFKKFNFIDQLPTEESLNPVKNPFQKCCIIW